MKWLLFLALLFILSVVFFLTVGNRWPDFRFAPRRVQRIVSLIFFFLLLGYGFVFYHAYQAIGGKGSDPRFEVKPLKLDKVGEVDNSYVVKLPKGGWYDTGIWLIRRNKWKYKHHLKLQRNHTQHNYIQ